MHLPRAAQHDVDQEPPVRHGQQEHHRQMPAGGIPGNICSSGMFIQE